MIRFFVLLAGLLAYLVPLRAQFAHIDIEPDTVVLVGQEIFFTAGRSPVNTDVELDTFYWDFGDDYALKWEYPSSNSNASGLSCCHYYMQPGTYTVKLVVHDADGIIDSTTRTVTVTGEERKQGPRVALDPLLEIKFEDNGDDTSPSNLTTVWHGTSAYTDGIEGRCADLSGGAYLEVRDSTGVLGGMDELTVSFWIRKPSPAPTSGSIRIFEKSSAYYFLGGNMAALGQVYTTSGNDRAGDYNFYPLRYGQMWHHVALVYDGDSIRVYIDRKQEGTEKGAVTGTVNSNANSLTIGAGSRDDPWTGYIDEVKVYDRALSVHEIYDVFEVWHAPYHGRIEQYLYTQVPGEIAADPSNRLRITVEGDLGHSVTLMDEAGLELEEVCLLSNKDLPADDYTMTAQLLNGSGQVLETIIEKFSKPYDGIPRMGIDRYNALCRNGEPFFLVRALGLDAGYKMNWWAMGGYINGIFTEGWNSAHTVASYGTHLDQAQDLGLCYFGPGGYWTGKPELYYERNINVDEMVPYFETYKDHPAQLAWFFDDEPNLGGYSQLVPSPVLRSWTYCMHKHCPQQFAADAYAGAGYFRGPDTWHRENVEKYSYLCNANMFGTKTHVSDIIWWDAYPSEQGDVAPDTHNIIKCWADAIEISKDLNYDLVPIINCMETQDIHVTDDLRGPTPEEVRMMAWLNIVHGMKGLALFHYFADPQTETYAYLAELKRQTDLLGPVIVAPPSGMQVTDDADEPGNRVDLTVREDDDYFYIFAVRLTERWETEAPYDIDVTFTVSGSAENAPVVVPSAYTGITTEYLGGASGQQFSLAVNGGNPITPGTVQIVGGPYGSDENDLGFLWDNGDGTLSRLNLDNTVQPGGTIDYGTGQASVDFGVPVPAGTLNIVASCQPDREDLVVDTVNAGMFTNTFAPNDVRVYRIDKADVGIGKVRKAEVPVPELRFFPSPSYGIINVSGAAAAVSIRSLDGALLADLLVTDKRVDWARALPGLPAGVYLVSAYGGNVRQRIMLMK